jgi:hypothetical protein
MNELLLGTWGPKIFAYGHQYPRRVLAASLVGALVLDLMFANDRSSGDAGGGGCGD